MKLVTWIVPLTLLSVAQAATLPHLDLDMTSEEYRTHLSTLSVNKMKDVDDPAIAEALRLGERLSKWIQLVNTGRGAANALRLTSPQLRRGVPIDKPSIYNPQTVKDKTAEIMAALPAEMKAVLSATGELPATIPMDDETFLKHARLVDKNYQTAARWKSLSSYMSQYAQLDVKDVRGYWYLTTNHIGPTELRDTSLIAADKVQPIKDALIRLCKNAGAAGFGSCDSKVETVWKNNDLANFYNQVYPGGKRIWDNFFVIGNTRSDIHWTDAVMTVPFNTPTIEKFTAYLRDNIQDEWRFGTWALKLAFGTYPDGPRLTFQSGVVPHVNGLAGNQIVMDSNQPVEEYESQWTIRHEFGHVLGFPDCYHEFYDTKLRAFVNYQLDTSDLMCSRAGNMKERLYTELKRVYKK